jgi:hypothetical protein
MDNPNGAAITNGMEYRGVEYSIVQGVERGKWIQASNKPAAVIGAQRAIDRALDPKKRRLVPPRS